MRKIGFFTVLLIAMMAVVLPASAQDSFTHQVVLSDSASLPVIDSPTGQTLIGSLDNGTLVTVVGDPVAMTVGDYTFNVVQITAPYQGYVDVSYLVPIPETAPEQPAPECQYQGTGSPQPEDVFTQIGEDLYYFDPATTGCAFIVEGRFPWQDDIAELPGNLASLGIVNPDGGEWLLWDVHHIVADNLDFAAMNARAGDEIPAEYRNGVVCVECSIWFYDPSWNMNNTLTTKPSIAEEFEAAKLADMQDATAHEPYLWPRIIWDNTGTMVISYKDTSGAQFYTGCTSGNEPERIPVHGMRIENGIVAAVGANNCTTVAWIDGADTPEQWTGQRDADNSVQYQKSIEAWLMPSNWDQTQIDAWIAIH